MGAPPMRGVQPGRGPARAAPHARAAVPSAIMVRQTAGLPFVPPESAHAPGAITRRFLSWTLRHGKLLWALALLLAIPASWRTANLYRHLRSEIEELLPRSAPSVVAIDELRHRMAGLQYLGVLVEVGNANRLAAGERFLDDLAARVRSYPRSEVSDVRTGFAAERAFVEGHATALLDLEDLKAVRERIEDRLHWEYANETGTLLDPSEPAPSLDFSDIEKKYSSELGGSALEGTRFSSRKLGVTVLVAIVLFYGWGRAIPALFLPLAIGAVYAFALASLPPFGITELNSNTAFLGSIIVGNGINFGIIQLARYVEARRQGETVEDSLALALWATRKGTLSAALAAGVAYASLVAMQFRGFRQFGVIGGLGMLLAWATTYLLMPPLIGWLDRGKFAPQPRWQARSLMAGIARAVAGRPRVFAAGAAIV